MQVIICGAGQVGYNIARYLSSENADITVVDQSPELVARVKALLRRVEALEAKYTNTDTAPVINISGFLINAENRQVRLDGKKEQ